MATLRDKLISSTYPSLLHTNNELEISPVGVTRFQDGAGNDTSLLLGLDGQGAAFTGGLSAFGVNNRFFASNSNGIYGGTISLSSTGNLTLSGKTNTIVGTNNIIQGNNTLNGNTVINAVTTTINSSLSANAINARGTIIATDLKVGVFDYPTTVPTGITPTSPDVLFVQMNQARNALVFGHVNPADIQVNDPNTITRTVYANTGSQNGFIASFPLYGGGGPTNFSNKATTVVLPLPDFANARGGVFFLTMDEDFDDANLTIIASPERTAIVGGIPVIPSGSNRYAVIGGSGDSSGDDQFRCAGQFQVRLNSTDPVLSFTNIGTTQISPGGNGVTCSLYQIARQY